MLKKLMIISALIFLCNVFLPLSLGVVLGKGNENRGEFKLNSTENIEVYSPQIYYDEDKKENKEENKEEYKSVNFEENDLEEYITGVVAAEMPANFNMEALKAQAVAARTYAIKHLNGKYSDIKPEKIGQAYINQEEMKRRWGNNFNNYYNKIKTAVYSTKGLILEYNGEAIEAVFHSTSSGMTENSENVWGKSLPYIKSVESKVDEKAPNFCVEVSFEKNEFEDKIKKAVNGAEKVNNIYDSFKITKRSSAGYVLEASFGNIKTKGSEIRTALGLRSTDFEIKRVDNKIIFTTKGYGHGAGMSQYGAEFMAQEGKSYKEILSHYYSGAIINKFL